VDLTTSDEIPDADVSSRERAAPTHACYVRALASDVGAEGLLEIDLGSHDDGVVMRAAARRNAEMPAAPQRCLVHELKGLSFAPPRAGVLASVHALLRLSINR
jgi:hypothetical protein